MINNRLIHCSDIQKTKSPMGGTSFLNLINDYGHKKKKLINLIFIILLFSITYKNNIMFNDICRDDRHYIIIIIFIHKLYNIILL